MEEKKKGSVINNKELRLVFPLTFSGFTGQRHLLHPNVQVGIFGAISKLVWLYISIVLNKHFWVVTMITMEPRVIGDYIMGPPIGSGSFAVVWRSRHRVSGLEVAIKEIDQRQLSPKVKEHLLKEISILSTIKHPNIVRLFETIQVSFDFLVSSSRQFR